MDPKLNLRETISPYCIILTTMTKKLMTNELYKILAQGLHQIISKLYSGSGADDSQTGQSSDNKKIDTEEIYEILVPAPQNQKGHVAFACFSLAKRFKKAPQQIASDLFNSNLKDVCPIIEEILLSGPYINFNLKKESIGEIALASINNGDIFKTPLVTNAGKWMIEYSQPNTHKVLHVGHMRNLCLGNALVRMCRYAGIDMTSVTYPGDVGTHVAKCLWYLKKYNNEPTPDEERGAWLGKMYTKANTLLEEERGTDKEESNRSELTAILKELHDERGPYFELWKETKEWSVDLMKDSYDWADVAFDRWFWESEMDAPSLSFAHQLLEKGFLVKDDGAIGMDLSDDKLGFCLLVKSDGTGLYATKDVELARKKFEDFGITKNIYIVDDRQAHHFKQVFKVLERIGFEQAKDCFHLKYAMVELPDGGMSSRKGNIVPLMDLVSEMEKTIKERFLAKYLEDETSTWSQQEVDKTAKIIANGAIKYGMVRVDNNRKIVFNIEEWLKLDGETGPYLQYVHARIISLSKKLNFHDDLIVDWNLLTKDQEVALAVKLIDFNDVVTNSVLKLQTMPLTSYLYDLCKLFNSFYAECSVSKAENETLRNTRLALACATGKVIKKGLEILGIEAPEKM